MTAKRFMKIFRLNTIKGRLQLGFICLLLLIILVASYPLVFVGKKQRIQSAQYEIEKMIDLQQLTIEEWLNKQLLDIATLSQMIGQKTDDIDEIRNYLKIFNDNHLEYKNVGFVNAQGDNLADTQNNQGINVKNRDYFSEARRGNEMISDVLIGKTEFQPIVVVSVPIFQGSNFKGLVFGTMPIESVLNYLENYRDDARETYLVDKNGMLVSMSRQANQGEKISSDLINSALKFEKLDSYYQANNGDRVLGDFRWVNNNRWLVIGEIKKSEIDKPFMQMLSMFAIGLIIILLVGVYVIATLTRQINRPLQRVLEGTKQIGSGSLHYRIDDLDLDKTTIEFEQLSNQFNDMAVLIQDNIQSLAKSEERFRVISEYSSDIIFTLSYTGEIINISELGKSILKYDRVELEDLKFQDLVHEDDLGVNMASKEELDNDGYVEAIIRLRAKDDEYIWLETRSKLFITDKIRESEILVVARNITERVLTEKSLKEANEILKDQTLQDGLLGIWNRRAFDEKLIEDWRKSQEKLSPLSLMMIDIDFFKNFNDTYGHQAGDDCLREVSRLIKQALGKDGGNLYRYGGEEFAVILLEEDKSAALRIANQARKKVLNAKIKHESSTVSEYLTVSIGVHSLIPAQEKALKSLIEKADKALYKAKSAGRNQVRFFEAES